MSTIIRKLEWPGKGNPDALMNREWIVTNGLGGYAAGTLSGALTRRFHGLLIAALPSPLGRMMMLNQLHEHFRLPDGTILSLCAEQSHPDTADTSVANYLAEFRLEYGLPVWVFQAGGMLIEKRIVMPYRQNTVHVNYRILSGEGSAILELRPAIYFRPHEARVDEPLSHPYTLVIVEDRYEIQGWPNLPVLRIQLLGNDSALMLRRGIIKDYHYRVEARRGYDSQGVLWSPGFLSAQLSRDHAATFIASCEAWTAINSFEPADALRAEYERRERLIAVAPPIAHEGTCAELLLASDQFIIVPAGRVEDAARAQAAGDEIRSVIAGYHWFTDWGRDTMISLDGLTLATGRYAEARWILRTFAHYVRDGLIPNMFPEGENQGLYHTADASLWFFHAVDRYFRTTGDRDTLRSLLPALTNIVEHHISGTHFGIGVDPKDGLLVQGAEGFQLTWMDAKVGDWVVTPRRGKAVEINALWYNALRLLAQWTGEEGADDLAARYNQYADLTRESFNHRFWYEAGGYLLDIVDGEHGDDPACRPNQLLAFALSNPVLAPEKWPMVLDTATSELLTPVGLRSLSPKHPDYQAKYDGDLRARDAAYHQGTVWTWLMGPFIDCWLKVHPNDLSGARTLLADFDERLNESCIGTISEIFDAAPPFLPRGCVSQAWSVSEILRSFVKTARNAEEEAESASRESVTQAS